MVILSCFSADIVGWLESWHSPLCATIGQATLAQVSSRRHAETTKDEWSRRTPHRLRRQHFLFDDGLKAAHEDTRFVAPAQAAAGGQRCQAG